MSEDKLQTELLKKVLKTTESTQRCVSNLEKKVDLHIQKTEYELKAITETNERQNTILAEHHQRSDEIKKDNELRETALRNDVFGKKGLEPRVTKLEEPQKARSLLGKWAWIGAKVITGSLAVLKLIDWISKYL